jgi:hypothetical protein
MISPVKICDGDVYHNRPPIIHPKAIAFVNMTPQYHYINLDFGRHIVTPIKGHYFAGANNNIRPLMLGFSLCGVRLKSIFFKKNPKRSYFYNLDIFVSKYGKTDLDHIVNSTDKHFNWKVIVPKSWEEVNYQIDLGNKDMGLLIASLNTLFFSCIPISIHQATKDVLQRRCEEAINIESQNLFEYVYRYCTVDPKLNFVTRYLNSMRTELSCKEINKNLIRYSNILKSHLSLYMEKPLESLDDAFKLVKNS